MAPSLSTCPIKLTPRPWPLAYQATDILSARSLIKPPARPVKNETRRSLVFLFSVGECYFPPSWLQPGPIVRIMITRVRRSGGGGQRGGHPPTFFLVTAAGHGQEHHPLYRDHQHDTHTRRRFCFQPTMCASHYPTQTTTFPWSHDTHACLFPLSGVSLESTRRHPGGPWARLLAGNCTVLYRTVPMDRGSSPFSFRTQWKMAAALVWSAPALRKLGLACRTWQETWGTRKGGNKYMFIGSYLQRADSTRAIVFRLAAAGDSQYMRRWCFREQPSHAQVSTDEEWGRLSPSTKSTESCTVRLQSCFDSPPFICPSRVEGVRSVQQQGERGL